jgi:hypothetical protein
MELPPLAAYITMKGPYISSDVGEGIKGITIYEFDESRYAEAMNYLGERVASLFGVPGFTYSLKMTEQYVPHVLFETKPVSSADKVNELIAHLSG